MAPAFMGVRDLKALAARHGIRPRKSLGQHFLTDPNTARRIVAEAGVAPGDRVLEIGAGMGSLTLPLAAAGARVLAVESDPGLVRALKEVTAPWPGIEILDADATRTGWQEVLGRRRWKMVSNLPYNIATSLVVGMLEQGLPIDEYVVMVQREAGERLVAGPGDEQYGGVSLRVRYFAEADVVRRVPATVFWPRPAVESVIVRISPRRPPVTADRARLFALIGESFAQRRKTVRSALRRIGGMDLSAASEVLEERGIDRMARPEELSLEQFAAVTEALL